MAATRQQLAAPNLLPSSACQLASVPSKASDRDACSWLAGWAAVAARKDAIPEAVLQQLDRLAYGGRPAPTAARASHSSLPMPATAAQPPPRSRSTPPCPVVDGRKRKALDPRAAALEAGPAAKLARGTARAVEIAASAR